MRKWSNNFSFRIQIQAKDNMKCIKILIVIKYILIIWYANFLWTFVSFACAIFWYEHWKGLGWPKNNVGKLLFLNECHKITQGVEILLLEQWLLNLDCHQLYV
jgi:hypothetical protein